MAHQVAYSGRSCGGGGGAGRGRWFDSMPDKSTSNLYLRILGQKQSNIERTWRGSITTKWICIV